MEVEELLSLYSLSELMEIHGLDEYEVVRILMEAGVVLAPPEGIFNDYS